MATHETSIPSDPTQERFAGIVLYLDHVFSIAVDLALLIIDRHLAPAIGSGGAASPSPDREDRAK